MVAHPFATQRGLILKDCFGRLAGLKDELPGLPQMQPFAMKGRRALSEQVGFHELVHITHGCIEIFSLNHL